MRCNADNTDSIFQHFTWSCQSNCINPTTSILFPPMEPPPRPHPGPIPGKSPLPCILIYEWEVTVWLESLDLPARLHRNACEVLWYLKYLTSYTIVKAYTYTQRNTKANDNYTTTNNKPTIQRLRGREQTSRINTTLEPNGRGVVRPARQQYSFKRIADSTTPELVAAQCNAMQCDAMRCNAMQFNAMQSDAMLYCATQLDPFNLNYSIQSECPLSYIHSASARATVEEVLVRKSRLNANRAWISAKRTPLKPRGLDSAKRTPKFMWGRR